MNLRAFDERHGRYELHLFYLWIQNFHLSKYMIVLNSLEELLMSNKYHLKDMFRPPY